MIVSALVLTCTDSIHRLAEELAEDLRLEVGEAQRGFLPLVATTASLKSSRLLCEELRTRTGVLDVQLVSWSDDDLISSTPSDQSRTKELQ